MPVSVNVTLRNPAQTVSYTLPSGAPTSSVRELVVGVYAPSQPGDYPVIVYSHGHFGSSVASQGAGLTAQALADLGYIVLMPNHLDSIALYPDWIRSQFTVQSEAAGLHRAADMQFVLTQAATLVGSLPPGYTADLSAPVAAGHSNGAFTSAVLGGLTTGLADYDLQPGNPYGLTNVTDARFKALILISPQGQDTSWPGLGASAWSNISIPTLIITGDEDDEPLGGPGRWEGRLDAFRHSDHAATMALVYRGAGHSDIGGNTTIPGLTASIAASIDRFLGGWLRDDQAALATLNDPTALLAADPLLFQAFVRAVADTRGQGAIHGTSADDSLEGLQSDDVITGGAGDDLIRGGLGNDIIDGGTGVDQMYGGNGNDIFHADTQADLVFENAGEGYDTVMSSAGFYLYDNIEALTLTGSANIFGVGNALDNALIGNSGDNLLLGGAGNDTVTGGAGNDSLFGEAGADILYGGAGIDYLVGGTGNDVLFGETGADALYGEDGDDVLWGGSTFDTDILVGGEGNDILRGDSGLADYDLLDGDAGDDIYWVDTGDDLTFEDVGGGNDTVYADVRVANAGVYLYANVENLVLVGTTAFGVGNGLDNLMIGSASGNYLLGGAGNDVLDGRGGNDVLFGEAGNDVFVFQAGSGGDVIGDFTIGSDRIDLKAFGFANFADLAVNFSQVGADGAINLGNGDFIVLHGVTMANLTAAQFIFPGQASPADALAGILAADDARFAAPVAAPAETGADAKADAATGPQVLPPVPDDFVLDSKEVGPQVLPGLDADDFIVGKAALDTTPQVLPGVDETQDTRDLPDSVALKMAIWADLGDALFLPDSREVDHALSPSPENDWGWA